MTSSSGNLFFKQNSQCPLCNDVNGEYVGKVEKIWDETFAVCWCHSCELFFLSPPPLERDINALYADHYWPQKNLRDVAKTFMRTMRVCDQVAYISSCLGEIVNKNILEVGSADARFVGAFSSCNNVKALEPSFRYARYAHRKYGVQLCKDNFFSLQGKWDIILMSHVLEHFSDPRAAMEQAYNLLTDHGYVFVEVPHSPLPDEVAALELSHYLNTAHIVNFRVKSLELLLQTTGFSIHSLVRSAYNLHGLPLSGRKRLKAVLLGAMTPCLGDIPCLLRYIMSVFLGRRKPFCLLPLDASYDNFGDNMRVLVQKNAS